MIPDVIYLQWFDEDGEKDGDVTWCKDRINDTDIEYRRLTSVPADSPMLADANGSESRPAAAEHHR